MGFDSGSISFQRFSVAGATRAFPDQETLDKFAALALREDQATTAEVDYGWCGARDVFDADFGVGNCVYNDCIHVGLRIDTNKIPAELKKAYVGSEERASAANNPSGFVSRKQKRDARETAKRQIEEKLASGGFRRSKLIPVLWDFPANKVYAPVCLGQRDQLMELFERTFDMVLIPLTSGSIALGRLECAGRRREYEDLTPTRFVSLPGDLPAEYPWTAKGDQAKDFLGNEFLLWLWWRAAVNGGEIKTDAFTATVMFGGGLLLDCAFGSTGRIAASFETPTEMAEALDALRAGKVPRRAGLAVALHGQLYTFFIAAETLAITSLKLPEIEKADSPRVLFEERITLLRDLMKGLDGIYAAFLADRAADAWTTHRDNIRRWMVGKAAK